MELYLWKGRKAGLRQAGVACLLLFCPFIAHAQEAERIAAIEFRGNNTTQEQIMLQEIAIREGDPVNARAIRRAEQALMDLGLFKSVKSHLEQIPDGQRLVFTVEERYYYLPLPLLDYRPEGDFSYGVELRVDNLAGLNQRLNLSYEYQDSVNGDQELSRLARLRYNYPRIVGTVYALSGELRFERREVEEVDEGTSEVGLYELARQDLSVGASRWLLRDTQSQGWRVGAGVALQRRNYHHRGGPADLLEEGLVVSTGFNATYHRVHELKFHREGQIYGYRGQLSLPPLGSDFSFNRHELFYRGYRHRLEDRSNLNTQLRIGVANGRAFGAPTFELGGATTLRGYESEYATGDAYILANIEYLHPISGYRQLRAVGFTDIGNAYPGTMEIDATDLNTSIGAGLRWRVQSFVDVTITLDFAYGVNADATKTYLSTSGTF